MLLLNKSILIVYSIMYIESLNDNRNNRVARNNDSQTCSQIIDKY